jgi:hypothetical protein
MWMRLIRLAALTAILFAPGTIRAGEAGDPVVVLIVPLEHRETSEAVAQACRAQLTDLRIRFELDWVEKIAPELARQEAIAGAIADRTGALAVFWYDIAQPESAHFYLSTSQSKRILVRRLDNSNDSNLDEMVAVIARSSIHALLDGGQIGVGSPIADHDHLNDPSQSGDLAERGSQAPHPAPASEKTDPPKHRIAMEVSYIYQAVSEDHLAVNGAAIAARLRILGGWYGIASYLLVDRIEAEGYGVQMTLERHPFLLGSGYCFSLGRTCIGGLIAFGLEIEMEKIRTLTDELEPVKTDTHLGASLLPAIRLDVQIIGPLSLYLMIGVEIELNRYMYTVNNGLDRDVIFESWPVQPTGLLGVSTAIF